MANEEQTYRRTPASTVRQAAHAAAEVYAPDELEKHAQAIMEAWTAKMKKLTDEYAKQATALARGEGLELAGPITPTVPLPYPWWNILLAGPYQPAPLPGGPYLAHKIFQPNEPALMVGAIWLNPAPINWWPPGPSAADVMGAFDLTINFEAMNLTLVNAGAAVPAITMSPVGSWVGPSWFKPFWMSIGSGHFAAPPQGRPHLYELNVTADVSGPVPQAFAGFCTWVFDPDMEPAIWPPFIPDISRPTAFAHWQFERPARFMVYTA